MCHGGKAVSVALLWLFKHKGQAEITVNDPQKEEDESVITLILIVLSKAVNI